MDKLILISVLFSLIQAHAPPKLNVPRVLLPIFSTVSTNYTLEVTGSGSVSRSDLVQIRMQNADLERGCSLIATISVLSKEPSRNLAIVLAEDVYTHNVIRADVIIDVINSLNIVTTTRELYMEEAPEHFEVRAYDDQGNEFTSLEGVEFKWNILGKRQDSGSVLEFITFKESPYEAPHSIKQFDSEGKQGHIVLIKGVNTGTAKVSVCLSYPEYKHVKQDEVSLSVISNLILEPSEAYILQGDIVHYRLLQVRDGRMYKVDLSSRQYSLISENGDIAEVQDFEVIAHALGKIEIKLKDANINDDLSVKLPTSHLYIEEPSYAKLNMVPYNNWVLVVHQFATIITEIYNKDNHKFYLGRNCKIHVSLPEVIFNIISKTENGTIVYGSGISPGVGDITMKLIGAGDKHIAAFTNKEISAKVVLKIYPEVQVTPERLILPWNPNDYLNFVYPYMATGGDGMYYWITYNHSVASVSQEGNVYLIGSGKTAVDVCMKKDPNIKATSMIYVIEPSHMEIANHINEAEVGHPIFLNIVLFGQLDDGERVTFSNCSHFEFDVDASEGFYYNKSFASPPIGNACRTVAVIGTIPGLTKVTVSFKGERLLQATTVVSAFKPLIPIHPSLSQKYVVLAVGSSTQLVFQYGPTPRVGKRMETYVSSNEKYLSINKVIEKNDLYVFSVTCLKIGETTFTLHVTSYALAKDSKGVEVESTVNVYCSHPESVSLEGDLLEECPIKTADFGYVNTFNKYKINVIIKDNLGRVFNNATSLLFKWTFDKNDMGFFERSDTVQLFEKIEKDYVLPDYHYKLATAKNKTGDTIVYTEIIGYRKTFLEKLKLSFHKSEDFEKLTSSFLLKIVDKLIVTPSAIVLFNHQKSKDNIVISNGSGYYGVEVNPEMLADVSLGDSKVTLYPGDEGEGSLVVDDICVQNWNSVSVVSVDVKVQRLAKLGIEAPDRVERDKTFTAVVSLYDKYGNPLNFVDISAEGLKLTIRSENKAVIEVITENKVGDASKNLFKFKLKSKDIGVTSVIASCANVKSDNYRIQVFEPLRILPRTLILAPGSEIQVLVQGGPSPSTEILYTVLDPFTISVSSTGVVKGLRVGQSMLKATSVDNQNNNFSIDSIEVKVVSLTGVKITAPTNTLLVGNTMPVWATGVPKQLNAFLLGSISPSLIFKWSVSSPGVTQLRDVLESTNIEVGNENRVSMRLKGLKPGNSKIFLSVTVQNQDNSIFVYNSSLEIQIVSKLKFINPQEKEITSVLIAPNSQFQLKTNMDLEYLINYKVFNLDGVQPSKDIASVDGSGILTGVNEGSAFVIGKARDKLGAEQKISLIATVKPVHYMMLNIITKLENDVKAPTLPQGLYLNFNVTYHDQYGTVFLSAPSQVEVRPTISDNVQYHPKTQFYSSVNLEKPGNVTLWLINNSTQHLMEDFVLLPVANHIIPKTNYMVLQEIYCFSLPSMAQNGVWKSNSDAIQIDIYGMARAANLGTAVISYTSNEPNFISSFTTIEVLPLDMILLGKPSDRVITNSKLGAVYRIPVYMMNEKFLSVLNMKLEKGKCRDESAITHIPFNCQIRFNSVLSTIPIENVFSIRSLFDRSTSTYACELKVIKELSYNSSLIGTNITLRVSLLLMASESLVLNFQPGIFAMTKRIHFPPKERTGQLIVSGTPSVLSQVLVEPSDITLFSIQDPEVKRDCYIYHIDLDYYAWSQSRSISDYFVTIYSPLTNQKIDVPILIETAERQPVSKTNLPNKFESARLVYQGIVDLILNHIIKITFYLLIAISAIICYFYLQSPENQSYEDVQFTPRSRSANPSPVLYKPVQ